MKLLSINRILILFLLAAFMLRIITMFYSFQFRQNTDILAYRDYARISFLYGLDKTYNAQYINFGTLPNNQPPGSLYIISSAYNADILFSKIYLRLFHLKDTSASWMNGPLIDGFLRFPSILGDLVIGFFIYKLVKEKASKKMGIIASSLFLFNPVIVYNSSFWGQMDSLNNLFFFLSLYCLSKKNYFLTLFFFLVSLFIKLSLLIVFPLFILIIYLSIKSKKRLILLSTVIVFLAYVLNLPVSKNPLWIINYLVANWSGVIQNITSFSFNFWWLVFNPFIEIGMPTDLFNFSEIRLINSPLSQSIFWGLPLAAWGFILFSAFLTPLIKKIIALKDHSTKPENLFLLFSIITLIGFIFLPKMHERYMYPVFPLLATYIGLKNKFVFVFLLLSLLNFINLYMVWHPMMIPILSYEIMSNHLFQWVMSFFTVLVSAIFYIKSIKLLNAKDK